MADVEDEEAGMAECPKCSQQTANENGGQWECNNGCDLDGYQQCPRCGKLYHGTVPFCSKKCEDAGLP